MAARAASPLVLPVAALLVYLALVTIPPLPSPTGTDLDPSWVLGLNLAHRDGLVHGRDVVWSYGPLGHLALPDPAGGALGAAVAYRLLVHLVWIVAAFWVARRVPDRWAGASLVIVLGAVALLDPWPDRLEIAIVAVALLAMIPGPRHWVRLGLLGALAGLALMVKCNAGLHALGLFGWALALTLYRERPLTRGKVGRAAACALVLATSTLSAYALASNEVAPIFDYFRYSWELVRGYSASMSLPGPHGQLHLAAGALAFLLSVPLLSGERRALLAGLVPAALSAFLVFKHAMVRQDGHAVFFHPRLALAALFLLVFARTSRTRSLVIGFQILNLAIAYPVLVADNADLPGHFWDRVKIEYAWQSARALREWPRERLEAESRARLEPLRLEARFQRAVGDASVDAAPWQIAQIPANDWSWRPRPVFQSYAAYTPALDELNAHHLSGDRASEFVLLRWNSIDGRHPFFETPLSWRALLTRYEVELTRSDLLLLRRREERSGGVPVFLGAGSARWNQELSLPPAEELLVMAADVRPSAWGALRTFLFRAPPVHVEARYRSGLALRWRAVFPNLSQGVPIGLLPSGLHELVPLFEGCGAGLDRVVSVRFLTENPALFEPEISIEWLRMAPPRPHRASEWTRSLPESALTPVWLPGGKLPVVAEGRIVPDPRYLSVVAAAPDARIYFAPDSVSAGTKTIIIRARWEKTDRVGFFFGRQVDGRGLSGQVPAADRWLDVYVHVAFNPFWAGEHEGDLRFDPVGENAIGARTDIAGVWASEVEPPADAPGVVFLPVSDEL